MNEEKVSELLWRSREMLYGITLKQRGSNDPALELVSEIDNYRQAQGWSMNGFGGESEHAYSVWTQLQLFEDRLRANKIHDPGCPVLLRRDEMDRTFLYVEEVDCTCWLSKERKT